MDIAGDIALIKAPVSGPGSHSDAVPVSFAAYVPYYYEFNVYVSLASWWLTAPLVGARGGALPLDASPCATPSWWTPSGAFSRPRFSLSTTHT